MVSAEPDAKVQQPWGSQANANSLRGAQQDHRGIHPRRTNDRTFRTGACGGVFSRTLETDDRLAITCVRRPGWR